MTIHQRDARGVRVSLRHPPVRIVSLVPSLTELLSYLDLKEEVVGLTRFCIHPYQWKADKTIVGGTKSVNVERVLDLNPDLVIANIEENTRPVVEALEEECPVYVSQVADLPDALEMIQAVGRLTNRSAQAAELTRDIWEQFSDIPASRPLRTAYLIWSDPYMTIGGDTFINDIMDRAGFTNVFSDENRYPTISLADLRDADLDSVFLSTEPYPFDQSHVHSLQRTLSVPTVKLVRGDLFSWYGSRLLKTPEYLRELQRTLQDKG